MNYKKSKNKGEMKVGSIFYASQVSEAVDNVTTTTTTMTKVW